MSIGILDIWKENADFIFRLCLRYLKKPEVAEDVRQDVFLKIISSKRNFKNRSSVRTWVYAITFRCCIDYFRELRRQQEIEDEILHTGVLCLNDSQTPVWEVSKVSKMPCPISQLFVELYFGEGWETTEIGQVFGFTKAYVNKKIQLGIKQLQELV
jgi:RNA polymerase sigma-70 factor (ECF subfamily)